MHTCKVITVAVTMEADMKFCFENIEFCQVSFALCELSTMQLQILPVNLVTKRACTFMTYICSVLS